MRRAAAVTPSATSIAVRVPPERHGAVEEGVRAGQQRRALDDDVAAGSSGMVTGVEVGCGWGRTSARRYSRIQSARSSQGSVDLGTDALTAALASMSP
jgi:hypothetical protein